MDKKIKEVRISSKAYQDFCKEYPNIDPLPNISGIPVVIDDKLTKKLKCDALLVGETLSLDDVIDLLFP